MSQDIISTKFYDSKINQIRTETEKCNDKYPFLLMPLRLETRYMQVDRPYIPDGDDGHEFELLSLIQELEYLFERMELIALSDTLKAKALTERMTEIIEVLEGKDQGWYLPYPENKWWEDHKAGILQSFNSLSKTFNRFPANKKLLFRDITEAVELTATKVSTYTVQKRTANDFQEAKNLIDKLNHIENAFNRIISKPSEYTSKTKHKYFNYLGANTDHIKEICSEVEDMAMGNLLANTTQIKRIKQFSSIYSSRLTQTKNVFNKIGSTYKRNEFLEKFESSLKPDINTFSTHITEVIAPKLEYIQKLKTVKTRDLLYQAKKIQFELQLIIEKGFNSYQQLRRIKPTLYGLLREFREMGHDIIVGPDWQANQLRATWSKIDGLLNDYTELVREVKGNNRYKRAALKRAVSHINENYRADLEGLKQGAPDNRDALRNSNFTESANAYNIAYRKMETLAAELNVLANKSSINKTDLLNAISKLQDFGGEFATLGVKTTIIPENYFKAIHYTFNRLKTSVDKIGGLVEGNNALLPHLPAMNNAVQHIGQSLGQLESDITDEKDPFYDDFRKKFVFALPTKTVDELWVRIYPDDIFVHSHEKAVTQDELDDTKYFWTEVWNADNDKEVELAAWRPLAIKYGENRASYLYQLLNPDKAQQDGGKPIRPIIDLNRKLETAINTYDEILRGAFHSSSLDKKLPYIKKRFTESLNLTNPLTSETYVLLNKAIDLTKQMMQKHEGLTNLIEKIQHTPIIISGVAQMLLSDIHAQINAIGEKLSKLKPVKDVTMVDGISIPNFPDNIELKENTWSEAPKANLLPDRFVFVGTNGNEITHLKVGKEIPSPLIVGINPDSADTGTFEYDDKGNLLVDENTRWLTDFEEAVRKGMGIIVPLNSAEKAAGFKKIIVLGINNKGAEESKRLFEELLEGHSFSPDGISMLPIGTPTNNTESKSSGFSSEEETDSAYERITGQVLYNESSDNKDRIDGHRLTTALGINPNLLNRLDNADRQDTYKSLLMNKALWNSTMGYYMEEVMDTVFTLDNNRRTCDYFTHYVSGRGWLPSLRIGTQPYGILPTTAFSRFRTSVNEEIPPLQRSDFTSLSPTTLEQVLQKRFDIRLNKLLGTIREQWMYIAGHENLKIDDFDPAQTSAQEHFMQLLGLQATSIEQYFRYNTNTAQRRSVDPKIGFTVNFSTEAGYGPYNMKALFGQLVDRGYYIDDTFYETTLASQREKSWTDAEFNSFLALARIKQARIFRLRYHNDFGQLTGPFVRENDEQFLKSVNGQTYIDKLLNSKPQDFWKPGHFMQLRSNSLFFMFLRQALALTYRDTALDILMQEKIINENTRRRAGSKGTYLIPGSKGGDMLFTKWDYLFQKRTDLEKMMEDAIRVFEHFPFAGKGVWNNSSLWKNIQPHKSLADYLYQLPENNVHRAKLNEIKSNFLELKALPVNELERLFAEHLDLSTYRFDAWQLGLANKRLDTMRRKSDGNEGIYLGAYGILEDLKPGGDRTVVSDVPEALKENDNKLVYADDDNEGFIHTPSINHALTAAILRSGYIANKTSGDLNNPMAVNLTSKRVRMALKLMQGIHNGQETGALLGYQFERGLHENYLDQNIELDEFIYGLRKKFPLVPDTDSESNINQNEEQSTMNVVDGRKLLDAVRAILGDDTLQQANSLYELAWQQKAQLKSSIGLPDNISNTRHKAILKEIDEMANAFDALGDLLVSESVYHIAQGNHVRSAAVFAALSEGRAPKEVQIIDTPRSGHVLTQRLILQLETVLAQDLENNSQAKPQYWQNIDFTPRSFAEPSLNKWLGDMIGDPALIRCYISFETVNGTQHHFIRLSDFGLQAIDIVYIMNTAGSESDGDLNQLVAYYARAVYGLSVDTELSIHFKDRNNHLIGSNETLSAVIKTFNEVLPLFSSLYDTITKSRFTAADDYVVPGEDIPDDMNRQQLDIAELRDRTEKSLADFKQIKEGIQLIFQNKGINSNDPSALSGVLYTTTEINTLRNSLMESAKFGLSNSLPDAAIETDSEAGKTIAKQAAAILKVMTTKTAEAEKLMNMEEELADKIKADRMIEAGHSLFGGSFSILPHFSLRNRQSIAEVLSLSDNDGLLRNTDEYAMDGWVEGIAKVRTKINKLEMVNTMATLFDTPFPDYKPVQLPFGTVETAGGETINDYWLGLEYPADYEPENDKLSLVMLKAEELHPETANAKCCGLLIDEWIEIIPQKEETSGVAFNYDQPDAEPPQSLLLAVPPVETGKWKWDDLVYTILDTMDLYKARLVEPEHIDKSIFTQVLPAVLGEYPTKNQYRNGLAKLGMFDLKENNKDIND